MPEIGALEAKTQLPQLLQRVEAGERFVITRHSHSVAELIPFQPCNSHNMREAIAGLKAFQETHRLAGLSVRRMIEEGRKH
jgi:antitoxin (DNA-binding transcriptional repressor) of toxin-antitoxin stability system